MPVGHMENAAKTGVARFVSQARSRAGSGAELTRVIEAWYGQNGKPGRSTVDSWANGSNPPPGWVLFALARKYDLSLDEFALSDEDRRSLADQLAELRLDVQALQVEMARLLEGDEEATAAGEG